MLDQLSVSLDTGSIQVGALSENTQKKSLQLENQSMQGFGDDHNRTCAYKVKNSGLGIQVLA